MISDVFKARLVKPRPQPSRTRARPELLRPRP